MSTELKGVYSIGDQVLLTRYWGGVEDGTCIQLTPQFGDYILLTKTQALDLALALVEFAKDKREELV